LRSVVKKTSKLANRDQFLLRVRRQIDSHLVDWSGKRAGTFAVYGLTDAPDSDPIDYIDITVNPQRRLLQHWMAARLWQSQRSADRITSSTLRPLCHWIRDLYEQQQRLPVMVIYEWLPNLAAAEAAALAHRNTSTHILLPARRDSPSNKGGDAPDYTARVI
jgi:hypothetical protein